MIDLMAAAAASAADQCAVVTPERAVSYGELLGQAEAVAAELLRRKLERFAVVEADAARVLYVLGGAALAGVEPCQYQADVAAAELERQAGDLGHSVVVTRRRDLRGAFEVVDPEDLLGGSAPAVAFDPGPQPLMIRTTGTTGTPKAARHDWRILARTVETVRPAPGQRWLLAYGPHQFAGIQVLMHVAASCATLVAPFPRQPRQGLEALMRDGVTCVSATPTYWRFLLTEARSRRVGLPPLEQVTLGGEASSSDLLDDLRSAFPMARISQVYASTEFGSVTSVSDGRPGISVEALFSEANPTSNIQVRSGELWVRARAGMIGYCGREAESPLPADDDSWRPTGDLMELVGDRLLFRGRTSEVINVGGVKVAPLPVEDRINALSCVAMARVFGRPNRLMGALVAAEVVPAAGAAGSDPEAIRREIREAVSDLPPAWHPRSVTFVDAIETRGGKTVRGVGQ